VSLSEPTSPERFKQLLFINDYPPARVAGAPILARRLLEDYPPERLDIVYCGSWSNIRAGLLPCRHTIVPAYSSKLRPRRFFLPIESTLNGLRLERIMNIGRRIAKERGVEAIFTTSYGDEMPHAAYFLSKELGLPFYYYEMDRLDAVFHCRSAQRLITRHRRDFLRHASKLWLISPAMAREFKRLYDVDGEPINNFIDLAAYQQASREVDPKPSDRIRIIYTGSILMMLYDALAWFCRQLNGGITIGGRTVELSIYSQACPPELLGPHVHYRGFVAHEEIPRKLAESDIALMVAGFDVSPGEKLQIQTSVASKTLDYLAAGKPVLIIAPPYSGQVDYYGPVSCVVDRLDRAALDQALGRLVNDPEYVADLRGKGFALIQKRHTLSAIRELFLSHFLTAA
jgi:glycosyltransferase involved in cell wall biosynthesis